MIHFVTVAFFKRDDAQPLRLTGRDTKDGQGTFLVTNDDTKEPELWTEVEVEQNSRFKEFLDAAPKPFLAVALICINVAVFVAMAASGVFKSEQLSAEFIRWGADYAPLTTHGQWWRLLTAMFLHFGFAHLAGNMCWLFLAGSFAERLFGPVRFTFLYLLSGIGGGIASDYWTVAVSAGASGAVFGIYGGILGFLLLQPRLVPLHRIRSIGKGALIFVVLSLIYSVAMPGINLAAHIGGFVTGLMVGGALTRSMFRRDAVVRLRTALVALAVAVAVAVGLALRLPAWDDLQTELQRLDELEKSTPRAFTNSSTNTPSMDAASAEASAEITERVLPQWEAERQRIARLRLPYRERRITEKIGKYISFREEGMVLLARGLQHHDVPSLQGASMYQRAANDIAASLGGAGVGQRPSTAR